MSTITKRQTYWRDHVLAAAAFNGTIVEYATLHSLKTKDIYQWKTALTKRGFLSMAEQEDAVDFVAVNSVEQTDTPQPNNSHTVQCRLTLPCGSVLEYFTPVEPAALSKLLSTTRSN
ncbi:MAG: hypothetical protein AB8B84_12720 [Granulosicoccus sp.]